MVSLSDIVFVWFFEQYTYGLPWWG